LRVRSEYIGKKITCKFCQGAFRPSPPEGYTPPPPASDLEAARERINHLEVERQRVAGDLTSLSAQYAAAPDDLRPGNGDVARPRAEAEALRQGAERAQAERRQEAAASERQLAEARAERDRLRAEAEALRGGREEAERLRTELDGLKQEHQRFEAQGRQA